MKRKIANYPEECRKIPCQFLGVILVIIGSIKLYVFGEVDNKAEILKGSLVDGANWVIDEDAGSKYCKCEYFNIVILVFIEGSYSLRIYNQNVNLFAIGCGSFKRDSPTPKSLCAGIYGGANTKTVVSIQKYTI